MILDHASSACSPASPLFESSIASPKSFVSSSRALLSYVALASPRFGPARIPTLVTSDVSSTRLRVRSSVSPRTSGDARVIGRVEDARGAAVRCRAMEEVEVPPLPLPHPPDTLDFVMITPFDIARRYPQTAPRGGGRRGPISREKTKNLLGLRGRNARGRRRRGRAGRTSTWSAPCCSSASRALASPLW